MTNTLGSFSAGIALFACIGTIIVTVLVVFAIRAMTGPGDYPLSQSGVEPPPPDDPNIDLTGGFGGVPTTGPYDLQNASAFGDETDYGPQSVEETEDGNSSPLSTQDRAE